jgi:hypothetical protein
MSVLYVALRYRFGHPPAVEAVGYTTFSAMLLFYTEVAYLRERPVSTQAILVGGGLAAMYLLFWAACATAVRL